MAIITFNWDSSDKPTQEISSSFSKTRGKKMRINICVHEVMIRPDRALGFCTVCNLTQLYPETGTGQPWDTSFGSGSLHYPDT